MKKYYLNIKSNKKTIKGYILDISYNGLGIACKSRVRKNTAIEIFINEIKPIVLKGNVVSCSIKEGKIYCYRLGVKMKHSEEIIKASLDKLFLMHNKRKFPRFPLFNSWKQD
ncbi:MAG: PilZ domain-containing protein [Candidatus Omnitrophica bacterium]|jgi:hypothetical protein|nr:PilZ domain-containing protein [Candidatus Omnitrophota bacterium]